MSFFPETCESTVLSSSTPPPHHCEQGLLGLANATRVLLRHPNPSAAFPRALEHLRAALRLDRLYLCEQRGDAFSLRFEALGSGLVSRLNSLRWQQQPYASLGLSHWPAAFLKNRSLGGRWEQLSPAERQFLELEQGQFVWLTPVRLPTGEIWGFLGCEHLVSPAYFGSCEQPLLLSLADNFGCAVGRQRDEQQMQHQAFHDVLTGLPNRMLFNDRLPLAIAHARRGQENMAVMFLDLDKFKQINDTLGHDYGDELLVQATQRLKSCLREEDILARWGGDEFTLCLPNLESSDDVVKVCQRLLTELRRPFEIRQEVLEISGSIGIAIYPQDGEDIAALLRHADMALYRVKQNGRDHYQFFGQKMNSLAVEQLAWAEALEQALRTTQAQAAAEVLPESGAIAQQLGTSNSTRSAPAGELQLYYQPLVRIVAGQPQIYALEALLRWQHPSWGLLTAADFLSHAEQAGLMVPLGHWMIQSVGANVRQWSQQGLALEFVSLNLSALQFQTSALLQELLEQGRRPDGGTAAEAVIPLALELDEATLCADISYTQSVLERLTQEGLLVALQQFGQDQLGIEALVCLPLTYLKLDPRQIPGASSHRLQRDQESPPVPSAEALGFPPEQRRSQRQQLRQQREYQAIAALLAFARQLSLPVVVQGVESEIEWERLRSLNCTEAQGNFFSPAIRAEQIISRLRTSADAAPKQPQEQPQEQQP